MAYQANNIRGQWKRAFASATLVGFGGLGGIAGSTVFRQQDSPVRVILFFLGFWHLSDFSCRTSTSELPSALVRTV
jgi:hypothetical protein